MKRYLPLVFIAIIIVAITSLNNGIRKTAPKEHDDEETAQKQKDNKPAEAAPVTDLIPSELIINDPEKAATKATIGWIYDPKTMADPMALRMIAGAIQAWTTSTHGKTSLVMVNLDVPKDQRSPAARNVDQLGLTIDGTSVITVDGKTMDLSDNIGEGKCNVSSIMNALTKYKPKGK